MIPVQRERQRFADTLGEVGPDAATLCEGWDARQLAAHVVIRERRPDAAPGILVAPLSGYTDKVQSSVAGRDFDEITDLVRTGPPRWSPTRIGKVDRLFNTVEFFVHHEDVRRALPDWEPRQLDDNLAADLDGALRRAAKMLVRKAPTGITLVPDGGEPIVAKDATPMVSISGPIGELVLFVYGRQDHAQVSLDGPADAVDALRTASFGI